MVLPLARIREEKDIEVRKARGFCVCLGKQNDSGWESLHWQNIIGMQRMRAIDNALREKEAQKKVREDMYNK